MYAKTLTILLVILNFKITVVVCSSFRNLNSFKVMNTQIVKSRLFTARAGLAAIAISATCASMTRVNNNNNNNNKSFICQQHINLRTIHIGK